MRKIFLSALLILFSVMSLSSQTINIGKSYRIDPKGFNAVLNTSGNLLAFTTENYGGLEVYDFSNKSVQKISDEPGAGFDPVFSDDGKLFYKNIVYKSRLRYEGLKSYDLQKKIVKEELEPQRNLTPVQKSGKGVIFANDKKTVRISSATIEKTDLPYIWSDGQNLNILKGEKTEILNPIEGANGYIWASLSPNGQMILFNAVAVGTFVCDLKGNIIASLGYLNAPVWYDNEFVVGMQDKDDGQDIIESKVIIKNLSGKITKQLSGSKQIAMFPTASSIAKKVAYNTIDGDIYVLELNITK